MALGEWREGDVEIATGEAVPRVDDTLRECHVSQREGGVDWA